MADVDGAMLATSSGWTTPAGGGLHLVTNYEHDFLGAIAGTLGPVHAVDLGGSINIRSISETLYLDEEDEVRTAQGYVSGTLYGTTTLYNPISIAKHDEAGRVVEQIQATQGSGVTASRALDDPFAQSSYVRWMRQFYNDQSQLAKTRVYHDIPASGEGRANWNYNETHFTHDNLGRSDTVTTAGRTVTFTTFDPRGLPLTVSVGARSTSPRPTRPARGRTRPIPWTSTTTGSWTRSISAP